MMTNTLPVPTEFESALNAVLEIVESVDPARADALEVLNSSLPFDDPRIRELGSWVRQGVEEGWLAEREKGGIRFGRVRKSDGTTMSVDCVHMDQPGPGHTHPNGEIDLCFSVRGEPCFDDHPPGWTVYRPGSWHVPTVTGGSMDILYFLPGGAIRFEEKP